MGDGVGGAVGGLLGGLVVLSIADLLIRKTSDVADNISGDGFDFSNNDIP